MSTNFDTATNALTNAISGPSQVTGDAGSVRSHPLPDLIAACNYAAAAAGVQGRRRGVRYNRLIPGGTVGRPALGDPRWVVLPSTFDRLGW